MLHNAHQVHVYHSSDKLVCRSVVVVRVRQNEKTRCGKNTEICCGKGQELNVEHAQNRTLLDRQKEQSLAECQAEIKKHEFQGNYDQRCVPKLSEIIEFQQEERQCVQAEELQRRDQRLLHAQLLQQNWELREAHDVSKTWKN